jgi:two-component system, cell cycle response regulator
VEALINHNIEEDIITLGFTARFLMTNLNRELIIERATESLGDFGRSDNIGIFLLDAEGQLQCAGGLIGNIQVSRSFRVALQNTLLEKILNDKSPNDYPLEYREGIPIPCTGAGIENRRCLCAPLVAANNQLIGMATFAYTGGFSLSPLMMQSLLLLLTLVAVALETARLFQQAIFDGLTGLYIRRYFDLRLAEEESRIKRYGGKLAILMLDIDHFKSVNDRYGHHEGDHVLRDVADIVMASVRQELDSPCRYGGEEFVVIMPDTDLPGALILAERIRESVQNHIIPWPEGDFSVTLSGGIAFMDQQSLIPRIELLKKADSALYRAKNNGRNQIQVWKD